MKKNKILKIVFSIIATLGLIISLLLLFPAIREIVILCWEDLAHKKLNHLTRSRMLFLTGKSLLLLWLSTIFFVLTKKGKICWQQICKQIRDVFSAVDFKSLKKPYLIMFGLYTLGLSALIRANFYYVDDLGRTFEGYRGWHGWSRYFSEFISRFVHTNSRLTDISPLTQILAVAVLAIASLILVYVFNNKKMTFMALIASLSVGLSPYFLNCLSYKFDSPYMACSVLFSIFPFLFVEKKEAFAFISVISLWLMSMSYQASSGIYIILVLFITFKWLNNKEKSFKETFFFILLSAFVFIFAMITFRVCFMKPLDGYATTSTFSLASFFPGIINNINRYFTLIYKDFNSVWKFCLIFLIVTFIFSAVKKSKCAKWQSLVLSLITLFLTSILSYGVYIVLANPLYECRAMYGFGVFLAVVSLFVVSYKPQKKIVLSVVALSWCFFVFAFTYGNALVEQKRYNQFRTNLIINDLNNMNIDLKKATIQLQGRAGFSPVIINNTGNVYPIINRLVPKFLLSGEWCWGFFDLYCYYNITIPKHPIMSGWHDSYTTDMSAVCFSQVKDNFYHTIKTDGKNVLIILK